MDSAPSASSVADSSTGAGDGKTSSSEEQAPRPNETEHLGDVLSTSMEDLERRWKAVKDKSDHKQQNDKAPQLASQDNTSSFGGDGPLLGYIMDSNGLDPPDGFEAFDEEEGIVFEPTDERQLSGVVGVQSENATESEGRIVQSDIDMERRADEVEHLASSLFIKPSSSHFLARAGESADDEELIKRRKEKELRKLERQQKRQVREEQCQAFALRIFWWIMFGAFGGAAIAVIIISIFNQLVA